VNDEVLALTVYNGEVIAGGGFTTASGEVSAFWARWGPACSKGNLNCDCAFSGADIDPFFLALGDPGEYMRQFPECDIMMGDMNGDRVVNGADIELFFTCLGSGGCP
jgi:hypothetical protein